MVSIAENSEVTWAANIAFDPADEGEVVDIVVVAKYHIGIIAITDTHTYYLTGGGEVESVSAVLMDEPINLTDAQAYFSDYTIENTIEKNYNLAFLILTMDIEDTYFVPGTIDIYVGYRKQSDASGKINFVPAPIRLRMVP